MITIGLYDPGMAPKDVSAPSWADVPKVLAKYDRTYTLAHFSENARSAAHANRDPAAREWKIRRRLAS